VDGGEHRAIRRRAGQDDEVARLLVDARARAQDIEDAAEAAGARACLGRLDDEVVARLASLRLQTRNCSPRELVSSIGWGRESTRGPETI